MRHKLFWHQVVLFFVLLVLTAARWLTGKGGINLELLWWWLGGVVGFLFVFCDRLVYAIVSNPEEVLSLRIKELIGRGKLWESLALALAEREKQKKLFMRSSLFVLVWAVISIFTLTSIANAFPRGFILGLGTHLIFDLMWDYLGEGREIDLWFWQIRNVSQNEIRVLVWGSLVFYLSIIWFL